MRMKCMQAIAILFFIAAAELAAAQAPSAPANPQKPTPSAPAISPFDFSGSFFKTFSASTTGNGTIETPVDSYGGMIGGRYIPSPWKGLEINYSFSHLNQNYSVQAGNCGLLCNTQPVTIPNDQSQVSVLYVVSRRMGTLTPFVEGGPAFVINSATGHGYAINTPIRLGYVAGAGADFGTPRIGLRVQFRDTFYKAPNLTFAYLPTGKFMQTAAPLVGVYFRPW